MQPELQELRAEAEVLARIGRDLRASPDSATAPLTPPHGGQAPCAARAPEAEGVNPRHIVAALLQSHCPGRGMASLRRDLLPHFHALVGTEPGLREHVLEIFSTIQFYRNASLVSPKDQSMHQWKSEDNRDRAKCVNKTSC